MWEVLDKLYATVYDVYKDGKKVQGGIGTFHTKDNFETKLEYLKRRFPESKGYEWKLRKRIEYSKDEARVIIGSIIDKELKKKKES